MTAMKQLINKILGELRSADFEGFTWQLENGVAEGIDHIPASKLENASRQKVVDLLVQQYCDNAGDIAVKALRNTDQNDLANKLEQMLQDIVRTPKKVDAPESELMQPDWKKPERIKPCSPETKENILRNRDEIYVPNNTSLKKGSALLITNKHNRPGAEQDEKKMEWLLDALGYRVEKHTDLSGKKIEAAVKSFAARTDHKDSDSTFVVIMSHGGKIQNKDAILGAYNTGPDDFFFVDDIFSHLNSKNCRALIDKPKVILIQACRGGQPGGVEISDQSDAWVHKEEDFACFMSSLPDIASYRHPVSGSYFIMYIVEVFCEWAHDKHIMELFRKVSTCMANRPGREENKLLPCIERTSLTKDFYLFPGL